MMQNSFQLLNDQLKYSSSFPSFSVAIKWNYICYNKLVICVNELQFAEIVVLFLMGAGLLCIILFNFITIRMCNLLPFFLWIFFPVLSVIIFGVIRLTVPPCVAFANLAEKFKAQLIVAANKLKSPYMRKRARAIYLLRINVGFPGHVFFPFGKSTKVSYYGTVICHTINLVMAVP